MFLSILGTNFSDEMDISEINFKMRTKKKGMRSGAMMQLKRKMKKKIMNYINKYITISTFCMGTCRIMNYICIDF